MKLAAIQMNSGLNIKANLLLARKYVENAASAGANLVVLPENFSLMSDKHSDRQGAAAEGNTIRDFLSQMARECNVITVGGSVPLVGVNGLVTNSCLVYNKDGSFLAQYDKIHLFDALITNGESYCESKYIQPGRDLVTVDVESTCIGLSICYDIRFPEMYRSLILSGAEILTVPAAFTIPTGRAHWELLLRARAVENLSWIVGAAQIGDHPGRSTWGHSMIVSPWGEVCAVKVEGEGFIIANTDLIELRELRETFPSLAHRRL
ncbi:MAG: acyltransferase [Acidiferrobacteraceae bacterium]|nr:acyltransferase [Acidiferrobacteraceae bacterium]